MRFLDTIRFTLGMLYLRIRYFFSRKKKILSHSKTQPYIGVLTLSELDNHVPPVQPTSQKQSCNPPKELPKKRDSKGLFCAVCVQKAFERSNFKVLTPNICPTQSVKLKESRLGAWPPVS